MSGAVELIRLLVPPLLLAPAGRPGPDVRILGEGKNIPLVQFPLVTCSAAW
jgi:hypothetical protein